MSKQNIYDHENFFNKYINLRKSDINANDLIEKPAIISLLPNLENKSVLDLGCGYGEHCLLYIKLGALKVVGVDISKNMIKKAKELLDRDDIILLNMPMEDINTLKMKFAVITSSLAFSYIYDFKDLLSKIYNLLNDDGILIFSQDHPLATSHDDKKGARWEKDKDGNKVCARIFDYMVEGKRVTSWYDEGVIKYHRSLSTIINSLIDTGFEILKVVEPMLNEKDMEKYPMFKDNYHRPDFLVIKARKRGNNVSRCQGKDQK